MATVVIGTAFIGGAAAAPHRSADVAAGWPSVTLSTTVDLPPWALDPPDWARAPFVPRDPPVRRPPRPVRPGAANMQPAGGRAGGPAPNATGEAARPAAGWRVADAQDAAIPPDGDAAVPEPPGYRTSDYRAPVPRTLAGATVVDTAAAERLWRGGARFIDVLPRPPRPQLPEGTVWRAPPREDIPGSIWLVNTGYGALAPDAEAYFRRGLETASGGDLAAPLVFYCQRDCWMSFNAARRALLAGYRAVHWYPLGTDGWAAAGLPLARNEPEPGEPGYPPR